MGTYRKHDHFEVARMVGYAAIWSSPGESNPLTASTHHSIV
jgi:hypothetical protein